MNKKYMPGKHFLQLPGPSNVPDRILRAMDYPTIDHRGPDFPNLANACLDGMKTIFKTNSDVIIFPASGTGAWEAALVNTINEGDLVLMVETGHFATLWKKMADKLGINTEFLETDWRRGVEPEKLLDRLKKDAEGKIKAVCVVHNETSTGSTSRIKEVRNVMNLANHEALLMVDTISGLASMDYKHDDWGVDVTISGSQKGLMLPPGLSFNAISEKAILISKKSGKTSGSTLISASKIATRAHSGMSNPSLKRLIPIKTSKTPSLKSLIISILSSVSISECI